MMINARDARPGPNVAPFAEFGTHASTVHPPAHPGDHVPVQIGDHQPVGITDDGRTIHEPVGVVCIGCSDVDRRRWVRPAACPYACPHDREEP